MNQLKINNYKLYKNLFLLNPDIGHNNFLFYCYIATLSFANIRYYISSVICNEI